MNESAISFVTDSDSVIIVKKNGKYQIANGDTRRPSAETARP